MPHLHKPARSHIIRPLHLKRNHRHHSQYYQPHEPGCLIHLSVKEDIIICSTRCPLNLSLGKYQPRRFICLRSADALPQHLVLGDIQWPDSLYFLRANQRLGSLKIDHTLHSLERKRSIYPHAIPRSNGCREEPNRKCR